MSVTKNGIHYTKAEWMAHLTSYYEEFLEAIKYPDSSWIDTDDPDEKVRFLRTRNILIDQRILRGKSKIADPERYVWGG